MSALDQLGIMLDPGHGPADHIGHDLRRAFSQPPRRAPRRNVRRLVTAGALATMLAAAVLVVQATGQPQAGAADVLNRAAAAAGREPELAARPDQFVFSEWWGVVPDNQQVRYLRTWTSVDGRRPGELRYRVKGSTEWHAEPTPASGRPAYHDDLPTDPDAMLHFLYTHDIPICDGNNSCVPRGLEPAENMAFHVAGDLLRGYVTPKARAALFQAAAKIPGTEVERDVLDAAGRSTIGVRLPDGDERGDWTELLFDPKTYRYLGFRMSTGGKIGVTAIERVSITDRPGQLP
ncbi:CU044_5270 family protein [Dactylosporangium sp. McL0621]|uniref:CU044_5270 family protein n=1 Tax=Dactylosporangium sp. McL0621 TaxID=3415678 RepID=UPI003CF3D975